MPSLAQDHRKSEARIDNCLAPSFTRHRRAGRDPAEFAGKRALVTGGAKGAGAAIAARLAAGAELVVDGGTIPTV